MLETSPQIPSIQEREETQRISEGKEKTSIGNFSSSLFTAAFHPGLVGKGLYQLRPEPEHIFKLEVSRTCVVKTKPTNP